MNPYRRLFALLAAFSLSAQLAQAQLLRPDFSGIHPLSSIPIADKYKIEDGPGKTAPRQANITQAQADKLSRILQGREGGSAGLPDALAYRVVDVVVKLDVMSGTPITAPEWDLKFAALAAGYSASFPAGNKPTAEQWEKGVDKLLTEMVSRAEDPHTQYFDREGMKRMREMTSNAGFVGIGAHVEASPEGVAVARALPGSPARAAGLRKGDVIILIDQVPAKGMPLEEAVTRMRGTAGTVVNVRIKRGAAEFDAAITRAAVASPVSFAAMAAPGIGYVYFSIFSEQVDEALFAHIDALKAKGAKKLIVDVRGNPGGLLNMAQSIVSEFLKNGQEIDTTRTRGLIQERGVTDGDGRFVAMPLAVLIDGGSASASEILAAALQDHARAKIIGAQSYGKGTFQTVMGTEIPVERLFRAPERCPDGAGMKVTSGGWYAPSGRNINGKHDPKTGRNIPGSGGVVPDVKIEVADAEHAAVMEGISEQLFGAASGAAKDSVLSAAISALSQP